MFYRPELADHGMAHDPFNALVAPRPIGWISSLNENGSVNLAPYSFYNAVSGKPPLVMFASSTPKDSLANAVREGEFVVNVPGYDLRHEMGESSRPLPQGASEPEEMGLEMRASELVKPPRVAGAKVALECVYLKTVELHDRHGQLLEAQIILGEVIGVFVDDNLIVDGQVDITRARPLSRLGYFDYASTDSVFQMHYKLGKE